jgi:murein DD-endopeptidase MepM/ murein hydrolase activator NlpD
VTEESRDPEATEAQGDGLPTDRGLASPSPAAVESPSSARAGSPSPAAVESPSSARSALASPIPPATESPGRVSRPTPSFRLERLVEPQRDHGRTIALGTLGGLLVLGAVLIARGPGPADAPAAPSPAALLTSAELPVVAAPVVAAPLAAVPVASATAPAEPTFVPAWRVAALESDPAVEVVRGTLGKHTFAGALVQIGLSKAEVRRVTHAADSVRRIGRGTPKDSFVVARDRANGTVRAFEFIGSPTDIWQAKSEDGLTTKKLELFVEKKRTATALVVTADLAKAIATAGLHQEAIAEIDDALEGHGDTAVIKPGVRLRVIGHEEWVEGAFTHFDVDAVEYVPRSGNPLRVYFYERDASVEGSRRRTPRPGFYNAKGQQPFRGTFRPPLLLARITSRFNPKRMHPVLHVVMPHNGIDFGASSGTPVYASGAGTVHSAGNGGPCGNMVQIEHAGGLTTAYCHLSRFAAGLHAGQHVEARQLVGYVGQTGRATGPHLHFAVKRGAAFLDPMVLKMDGVRTLPPADRPAFAKLRADLDVALEAIPLPSLDGVAADEKEDDKDEPGGEE